MHFDPSTPSFSIKKKNQVFVESLSRKDVFIEILLLSLNSAENLPQFSGKTFEGRIV